MRRGVNPARRRDRVKSSGLRRLGHGPRRGVRRRQKTRQSCGQIGESDRFDQVFGEARRLRASHLVRGDRRRPRHDGQVAGQRLLRQGGLDRQALPPVQIKIKDDGVGLKVARQVRPLLRGRCDVELDLTRPVQQMAHQGDRSRVLGDIEQDRVRQARQGRGGSEFGLKLSPQFGPKFDLTPR